MRSIKAVKQTSQQPFMPWAKAHGCGSMQTGGLKPLFAINDMGLWLKP